MSEYWIWDNQNRGWYGRHPEVRTLQLHLAGRFTYDIAYDMVIAANEILGRTDYPIVVMVVVNNSFLSREAQDILAKYEQSGDRKVIDNAYFGAQDEALLASPDLQESIGQMRRGEGREISPEELEERAHHGT